MKFWQVRNIVKFGEKIMRIGEISSLSQLNFYTLKMYISLIQTFCEILISEKTGGAWHQNPQE